MPSPHLLTVTRALSVVAAAALALALVVTPEPASARPPGSSTSHLVAGAADQGWARPVAGPWQAADPAWVRVARPRRAVDPGWIWPVSGPRVVKRGYEAPATRYSAGHRGIDIPAGAGTLVVAPESGTVRFAGVVVDRPTVTVQTSAGILLSIEPVVAGYAVGNAIERGSALGTVATGGHCSGACIHLGVRVNGEYVSPMRFFGGVPRAVLLPLA
jgi:murein DD-endopeptidase MepM/ murein hydrolase activator NlpD